MTCHVSMLQMFSSFDTTVCHRPRVLSNSIAHKNCDTSCKQFRFILRGKSLAIEQVLNNSSV